MLLTGFFTVSNSHQLLMIELNDDKLELFDSLSNLDFSLSEEEKEDEILFFNKLSFFSDLFLEKIKIYRGDNAVEEADYNEFLLRIANQYNLTVNKVELMLLDLISNPNARDEFWFVQRPLKFELYVSLLIYLFYGNTYRVHPNYSIDSNGLPYSHAPGGKGDIEIFGKNEYCLVEVSLIRNRDQQMAFESANLFRHVTQTYYDKKYMSFVAPYVHEDTEKLLNGIFVVERSRSKMNCKKFNCMPMTVDKFIDSIKNHSFFNLIENYSDDIWNKIRE